MTYEVVYNSDVAFSSNADLATYCIFYDQVLLPHTAGKHVLVFTRPAGSSAPPKLEQIGVIATYEGMSGTGRTDEDVAKWEQDHALLFDEGVISRLNAPKDKPDRRLEFGTVLAPALHSLLQGAGGLRTANDDKEFIYFREDHVAHFLRSDILQPQIFLSQSPQPVREVFKACQARAMFAYILPRISLLQPDQILEVRRKVKDTREGFSLHLQKLSEGIEQKLKGGESLDDIMRFAQSAIETKLIPDYREYVRQLGAERAGFWGKVLEKTEKVLQIDAAPFTPKFYGDFLKALGFTLLTGAAERKQRLSNASQAYQFMYQVETTLPQLGSRTK